jgi:hypothetical protein
MNTSPALLAAGMMFVASSALAQDDIDLVPHYTPHEPSVENFTPPAPEPPSYPNISTDSTGEPRLYIDPNHSFGGSVTMGPNGGFQGNYRFPMPDGN